MYDPFAIHDEYVETTHFLGEMLPQFTPDFGPDQFAAFLGAELRFSEDSRQTNWVDPVIDDWSRALPLKLDPRNPTWRKLLEYTCRMADHAGDRYLVTTLDYHSNADALSALRGPERFCMDFYDCPNLVARAMRDVRAVYPPVYEATHKAGRMGGERGSCRGLWSDGKFAIVSADVICMLGPEHFRTYVLPALEEEAEYVDHSLFHLDGPGALRHFDDILAIRKAHVLQWVPGAGEKPNWQWLGILKKAQSTGKAVEVYGEGLNLDAIKALHKELDPARVVYRPDIRTRREFDAALIGISMRYPH